MINLVNKHIVAYVNDTSRVIDGIFVDTVDELPESDEIERYELIQGSVAYVIKSGELFVMSSDGIWYTTNGEAVSNESA